MRREQFFHADGEVVGQPPQVGQQVRAGDDADVSLPFSDITVIFSPQPWNSGPSGYIALTSAAQEVQRRLWTRHIRNDQVMDRVSRSAASRRTTRKDGAEHRPGGELRPVLQQCGD